ncbi:BolA family protein [Alicycliphilus sp. B1]|nr:BolA family protein [Alicycliphilus sp. B1]
MACDYITLEGDGRHWYAVIVSADSRASARYSATSASTATLGDKMQRDEVHALSMKTFTPAEWRRRGSSELSRCAPLFD